MRSSLPLASLLIAACGTPDATVRFPGAIALDQLVPPSDLVDSGSLRFASPLSLTADGILTSGGTTDLVTTGAAAGESVFYVLSVQGLGLGPCPAVIGGVCLDVLSPLVLGSVAADANGEARFPLTVPAAVAAGSSLHLQSLVIRGLSGVDTVVSAPLTEVVGGGGAGVDIVDDFVHFPAAADILFVIDDSCSMQDEQNNLGNSFPAAIDVILDQGLDFHVGVVSTDMLDGNKSGRLQPSGSGALWIDPSDPNPETSFLDMANLGIIGSGTEEGLAALDAALNFHAQGHNLGFRRATAQLAVVVLSDEDDQSAGQPMSYADDLLSMAFYTDDVSFSSFVEPAAGCPTGAGPGIRYLAVTTQVGGIEASICANDFSLPLTAMVEDLWTSVPYSLSAVPEVATIEVTSFEGGIPTVLDAADWVYDPLQNTVRFTSSFAPIAGTDIEVAYTEL